MTNHYLLWATGQDRPGIVAGVTKELFLIGCNIEDSSMMRLGSEFGVLLIFSTEKNLAPETVRSSFDLLSHRMGLSLDVKKISPAQARFKPTSQNPYSVAVHGSDRPGIVYEVTKLLAHEKFNITDLSTHRTSNRKNPGFILIIEGEFAASKIPMLKKKLATLGRKIETKITLNSIAPYTL
jgi:glycine cleavage system transcriptional repressor